MKLSRLTVKDTQGRVLMQISTLGKVAFSRFPDMTQETKSKLLSLCAAVMVDNACPESDVKRVQDFLDFKSEENEFCS